MIRRMLKAQDIIVLLKLAHRRAGSWRQIDIARDLGLSQAEVHNALRRSAESGLYLPKQQQVSRQALLELLVHGVRYVFPAKLGATSRGMPTAWAAAPLAKMIRSSKDDKPVWPTAAGKARGPAVEPLYESVPDAAGRDPKLYELLVLVDAIRIGGAREREIAASELTDRLSA